MINPKGVKIRYSMSELLFINTVDTTRGDLHQRRNLVMHDFRNYGMWDKDSAISKYFSFDWLTLSIDINYTIKDSMCFIFPFFGEKWILLHSYDKDVKTPFSFGPHKII